MSRESDVYTALQSTALEALYLTGGLYKSEDLGREGISRTETSDVFDADGYLKPCGLIRLRSTVNTGELSDYAHMLISLREVIEITLYQDHGYATIDAAKSYILTVLTGATFSSTFEMELVNILNRQRDNGALNGASLIRMDWSIVSVSMDWPIGI